MESILWRRLDTAGAERAVLVPDPNGYHLGGTAVFDDGGAAYEVRYSVLTDPDWVVRVVGVHVQGPAGNRRLALKGDGEGSWSAEGAPVTVLDGILDVDLDCTPATSTLAIRRLGLDVGDSATITVAHLSFLGAAAGTEEQHFERTSADTYRFTSDGTHADLTVAANGFVTQFPGRWLAEAAA